MHSDSGDTISLWMATADVPSMPYAPALEAAVLITTDRIADAARRLLNC